MERRSQGKEKGKEQRKRNSAGPSREDFSLSGRKQEEVYLHPHPGGVSASQVEDYLEEYHHVHVEI